MLVVTHVATEKEPTATVYFSLLKNVADKNVHCSIFYNSQNLNNQIFNIRLIK